MNDQTSGVFARKFLEEVPLTDELSADDYQAGLDLMVERYGCDNPVATMPGAWPPDETSGAPNGNPSGNDSLVGMQPGLGEHWTHTAEMRCQFGNFTFMSNGQIVGDAFHQMDPASQRLDT